MNRSDLLNKVLNSNSDILVLKLATGVGKSKMALEYFKDKDVTIIVDKNVNKTNWLDEIRKFNFDEKKYEMFNYKSIHKVKNSDYLILDEASSLFSNVTFNRFLKLKFKKIVLLDATLDNRKIDKLKILNRSIEIISFQLSDAVNANILPKPKIIIERLQLDNRIRNHVFKEHKKGLPEKDVLYRDRYKYSRKKFSLNIMCTQKEIHDLIISKMKFARTLVIDNPYYNTVLKILGLKRKTYLASFKTDKALSDINRLRSEGKRFIVFAGSIEQAKMLGPNVVSSELSTKENRKIIDAFNNKEINEIINVGILIRAENLVDIDEAIIIQLAVENIGTVKQQIGRVLRGKNPIITMYIMEDTIDEGILDKVKEELCEYLYDKKDNGCV